MSLIKITSPSAINPVEISSTEKAIAPQSEKTYIWRQYNFSQEKRSDDFLKILQQWKDKCVAENVIKEKEITHVKSRSMSSEESQQSQVLDIKPTATQTLLTKQLSTEEKRNDNNINLQGKSIQTVHEIVQNYSASLNNQKGFSKAEDKTISPKIDRNKYAIFFSENKIDTIVPEKKSNKIPFRLNNFASIRDKFEKAIAENNASSPLK